MSKIKFFGLVVVCLGILIVATPTLAASDTEELQPAQAPKLGDIGHFIDEYDSFVNTNVAWYFGDTGYFPSVHIGEDVIGGVTYFNGTIANITKDPASQTDIPVTIGDDLRVDGRIWRGLNRYPNDGLPVIVDDDMILKGGIWGGNIKGTADSDAALSIYDTMLPGLDDANNLGSSSRRWQELYVSDNILGENIIHEDNLSVTNDPTANYYLGYAGNNRFIWLNVADHDTLSGLSCDNNQIPVWNESTSTWVCGNVADLDTLSNLSCDDGDIVVYDEGTTSWVCSAVGDTISDAVDRGETIISTDVVVYDHSSDGSGEIINSHIEQGRIEVTGTEISLCASRESGGGYANLGSATFHEAYGSRMSITATYEASSTPVYMMDTNSNILPIDIMKTTSGSSVTGFNAFGCPAVAGSIDWIASGE